MKKILVVMSFIVLCSCELNEPMYVNKDYPSSTDPSSSVPPPSFSHFTDIPIPENSVMNVERTFLLGAGEDWTGRLVFSTPYGLNRLFDFYMSEMPKFGWSEITVVRSQTSVLTFKRNNRIATIQLSGDKSSSHIDLTVSPQGGRSVAK